MVNQEALHRIKLLEMEYEKLWGNKVDYTVIPKGLTQERLVILLEQMIETGDSLLVANNKFR